MTPRLLILAVFALLLPITGWAQISHSPQWTLSSGPYTTDAQHVLGVLPRESHSIYAAGESVTVSNFDGGAIIVRDGYGATVYSGASPWTSATLLPGLYFAESANDRAEFGVVRGLSQANSIAGACGGLGSFTPLDETAVAFRSLYARVGDTWANVQWQSPTNFDWGVKLPQQVVYHQQHTGVKLIWTAHAVGGPSWVPYSSDLPTWRVNFLTPYTAFMAAGIQKFGFIFWGWEICNEPSPDALRINGPNAWAIYTQALSELYVVARAVRDQYQPALKLIGPSYQGIDFGGVQGLMAAGGTNLDVMTVHNYRKEGVNGETTVTPFTTGGMDEMLRARYSPLLAGRPLLPMEQAFFGVSAVGCPAPSASEDQLLRSSMSWWLGYERAIKSVVIWKALGGTNLLAVIGQTYPGFSDPTGDNSELNSHDTTPSGVSGWTTRVHPKTVAYLQTGALLANTTPSGHGYWITAGHTNGVSYSFGPFAIAWATEDATAPVSFDLPFTARTDIFSHPQTGATLTEEPSVFALGQSPTPSPCPTCPICSPPTNCAPNTVYLTTNYVVYVTLPAPPPVIVTNPPMPVVLNFNGIVSFNNGVAVVRFGNIVVTLPAQSQKTIRFGIATLKGTYP